jgi:hypothetical protein
MFHADLNLRGCKRHLNEEAIYYLVDSPWLDAAPWSYLQPVFDGISPVLTPECLNNVESLLCNTWFKQCSQVTDIETGENVYLPALMCQENCEEYRSVWDECVAAIEEDSEVLANFQAQRALLVDQMGTIINEDLRDFDPIPLGPGEWNSFEPLQCDVSGGKPQDILPVNSVSAFFFGQYPAVLHPVYGHYSMYFPLHTSPGMLYPKENSEYTDVKSGTVYDVPCFAPGEVAEADTVVCPSPFLSPTKANTASNCVKPCPVQAYDDAEYTQMWFAFCIPGLVGLVVNFFMGATWVIGTTNYYKSLPFNVKVCVFVGMYYCVVITLPSLVMKYDLACSCGTEECAGDGWLCILSRSGIYALLAILMSLCSLTCRLFLNLVGHKISDRTKGNMDMFSCFAPLLLCFAAYAVDSADNAETDKDNGLLNVARSAFTCSMRFPNMATEWALLHAWLFVSGVLIVIFTVGAWLQIYNVQVAMKSSMFSSRKRSGRSIDRELNNSVEINEMNAPKRRLLFMACMVSVCLLINTIVAVSISSALAEWGKSTDSWLRCTLSESWSSRNYALYGLTPNQVVCEQKEITLSYAGECAGDCRWGIPHITGSDLVLFCPMSPNVDFDSLNPEIAADLVKTVDYAYCDCSCDAFVQVERYFAQLRGGGGSPT